MKYYIASRLENAESVRALKAILDGLGWIHTYDWTVHGSIRHEGAERMQEVAEKEIDGVATADVVIVLLPGGRGTHVEIGVALACSTPLILVGDAQRDFSFDENTCAFYHAKGVLQLGITLDMTHQQIVNRIIDWLEDT